MKSFFTSSLLAFTLVTSYNSQAQYSASMGHTAAELATELTGTNVIVLNPVLRCRDSFSSVFSGTGELDFDNGVQLSTFYADKSFVYYDATHPIANLDETEWYTPLTADDSTMNNWVHSLGFTENEMYKTCAIELDVVPSAPTLELKGILTTGYESGSSLDCDVLLSDFITVLVSGDTFTNKNIAAYPGTEVPINLYTLKVEDDPCGYYEETPFTEYYVENYYGAGSNYVSQYCFTTEIPFSLSVTPCDTYHIFVGLAAMRSEMWGGVGTQSSFLLKEGSLRATGQPVDCPDPEDPVDPSSLKEYLKQQSQIKISPNPFNNTLAITIESAANNDKFFVSLTDIQGRTLKAYKGTLTSINSELQAAGEGLANGIYFLNVKSENGKYNYSGKVVKH